MDTVDDIRKIENFLETLKSKTEDSRTDDVEKPTKRQKLSVTSSEKNLNDRHSILQTCLKKNKECRNFLLSLESSLSLLLEECRREQKIVRENIEACENRKTGDKKVNSDSRKLSIRKTCSSPYFKNMYGFPSAHNEDVHNRRNSGYLDPWDIQHTSAWTDDQKRTLEKGIKELRIQVLSKSVTCCNGKSITNPGDICAKRLSLENQVVSDKEEYDWIKISVIDLHSMRSPLECCAMWYNYLCPTINKKRWTAAEGETLKELVKVFQYQNWEKIALCLGTGRSAYQCIGHFKIRLTDFSKLKWTDEEASDLAKYVNLFRVCHFIPWYKIAWLLDGRGSSDLYRKWINDYADIKKGKFSLQEDILLAAGLKQFGNDWCQIAEYFPNRHSIQLRGRNLVLKGRDQYTQPWTPYEDSLLDSLVDKYGFGNWAKISNHFLYRNNVQLRTRYRYHMRRREKTGSDGSLMSLESHASRTVKNKINLDGLWETAKQMAKDKLLKTEANHVNQNCDTKVVRTLAQIFKPRKKPGRKKGTVNFPSYHQQFYDFFHVAHSQRGGRGKEMCAEKRIPVLAYHIVLAIQLLDAKICLPSQKETVIKDRNMLEMDKSIICFFVDRKDVIQEKCPFIQFDDNHSVEFLSASSHILPESFTNHTEKETSPQWFPLISPCLTTLIGLRTMLLNRANLKKQSKGYTVQYLKNNSASHNQEISENKKKFRQACKLWNKRMNVLCTWAAYLSKIYPHDEFTTCPAVESDKSSEEPTKKRGRRKKKKANSSAAADSIVENIKTEGNTTKQESQKRKYVRSGQYSVKNQVSGSARRSTRRTKIDS